MDIKPELFKPPRNTEWSPKLPAFHDQVDRALRRLRHFKRFSEEDFVNEFRADSPESVCISISHKSYGYDSLEHLLLMRGCFEDDEGYSFNVISARQTKALMVASLLGEFDEEDFIDMFRKYFFASNFRDPSSGYERSRLYVLQSTPGIKTSDGDWFIFSRNSGNDIREFQKKVNFELKRMKSFTIEKFLDRIGYTSVESFGYKSVEELLKKRGCEFDGIQYTYDVKRKKKAIANQGAISNNDTENNKDESSRCDSEEESIVQDELDLLKKDAEQMSMLTSNENTEVLHVTEIASSESEIEILHDDKEWRKKQREFHKKVDSEMARLKGFTKEEFLETIDPDVEQFGYKSVMDLLRQRGCTRKEHYFTFNKVSAHRWKSIKVMKKLGEFTAAIFRTEFQSLDNSYCNFRRGFKTFELFMQSFSEIEWVQRNGELTKYIYHGAKEESAKHKRAVSEKQVRQRKKQNGKILNVARRLLNPFSEREFLNAFGGGGELPVFLERIPGIDYVGNGFYRHDEGPLEIDKEDVVEILSSDSEVEILDQTKGTKNRSNGPDETTSGGDGDPTAKKNKKKRFGKSMHIGSSNSCVNDEVPLDDRTDVFPQNDETSMVETTPSLFARDSVTKKRSHESDLEETTFGDDGELSFKKKKNPSSKKMKKRISKKKRPGRFEWIGSTNSCVPKEQSHATNSDNFDNNGDPATKKTLYSKYTSKESLASYVSPVQAIRMLQPWFNEQQVPHTNTLQSFLPVPVFSSEAPVGNGSGAEQIAEEANAKEHDQGEQELITNENFGSDAIEGEEEEKVVLKEEVDNSAAASVDLLSASVDTHDMNSSRKALCDHILNSGVVRGPWAEQQLAKIIVQLPIQQQEGTGGTGGCEAASGGSNEQSSEGVTTESVNQALSEIMDRYRNEFLNTLITRAMKEGMDPKELGDRMFDDLFKNNHNH